MVCRHMAGLAAACAIVFVLGCGEEGKGPADGGKKGEKRLTFAVIPKADVFTFWPTVRKGAEAACKELGIEMFWRGAKDETSPTDEIKIVEAMIERGVDGIVLAPQHAQSLVQVAEKTIAAGIPVVVIDSGLNSDKIVSFVATDNYQGGVMGAERLAKVIGEEGEVALIMNVPGSASTEEREKGFRKALEKYPKIKPVKELHAEGKSSKALQVVTDILTAHPNLAGIFTANEPGAIGAVNAVENEGRKGKVKIVGFDASVALIKAIQSGTLDSTIVQDPHEMGYRGVKVLYDHLQGKKAQPLEKTPIKLVTKENLGTPEIREHLAAYGALVPDEK
ncbi:MAG: substrate-binding domain-containing protein [Planctomycetes bacterium]|nr:substrate-binding domain-containing protein [Planctomycetota bacterium]